MTYNDVSLYRDDDHFNVIGAQTLAEAFLSQNGNPLNGNPLQK